MKIGLGVHIGAKRVGLAIPNIPADAPALASLLLAKGKSAIWLPRNANQVFSDTAGTTAITPGSGGAIARVNDYSGNGFPLTSATAGARPLATNGATFDNTNDLLDVALNNASTNYTIVLGYKGTDISGIFLSDTGTNVAGVFDSGTGSPFIGMPGSAFADGVQVTTRQALMNAINDGAGHRVELRGLTQTAPTLRFGNSGYGGFELGGAITAIVLIDNAALTAQQQTDALALAQSVINESNL